MSVFAPDCLAGHVALITGGGTGICRAIAHGFLSHGASVCITSRKQEVLDATAKELEAETGGRVLAVASDVRDPDAIASVVGRTVEELGGLDTLVNGAAGNFLAPVAGLSANGFRTVVDIDLCGSFNASKTCFEALKTSGDGLVLNITATLHYHGTPMQAHASAAKAGVDALTKNLAVEWGPSGIRVNGIAPGPIEDTEGMKRLAPGKIGDRVKAQIPLRRFGASAEIADAAIFLRTSAANYITGTTLVVDGGQCVVGHTFLQ
jgi:peroxisomal 2,4-dienoyl-CoA reductase